MTFTLTATGIEFEPGYGPVPPLGQVTFYDGDVPIDGCQELWLSSEVSTLYCITSDLTVGQHVISAEFYNVAFPYQGITLTLEGGYTVSLPLTLMPETLPVGGAGVPYSAQFSVSGDGVAPYTYALLTGDLPSGLSLSGDTLSGTPESEGIWEFTIQVTDNNAATASRAYSLEIISFPISGTVFVDLDDDGVLDPEETGRLPGTILFDQDCDDVYDGWFYTVAEDGTYYSDALPAGDNYCITPEPNEDYSNQWLPSTHIPYEITNLQAEVTELNFGFKENPLSYSPLQLPDAYVDTYYYETITVSGGTAPYAYTEIDDSLPAGLSMSFDGGTGVLTVSGTPTTAGFEGGFTGMVQDADGNQITFGMGIAVRLNVDPIFTFESNPNPSVGFEPVTFSFGALKPAAKYPDPIGVVSLFDGDLAHPIDGCQYLELYYANPVLCETTALAVGTHTILAQYQYDIYPDNQVSLTHVVSPDPSGPEITANIDGTLGLNGWYVSAVTLSWTVSDAQSPIGSQVGCDTITIEADQAKTTYTCTASSDGGTASETAIIGVDLLAPMVVLVPDRTTDINGWYNHLVHFTVEGQDDTSGTATCTPAFDYSTDDANALVTATCEDNAGNEGSETVEFQYDGTAPVVTVTAGREPDSNGWYNQAIGFTASGVDATSGNADCSLIDSYSGPDATGLTAAGSCTDNAGNVGNGALTFQFDATAPVVTVTADRDPNVNGWYNAAVSFTASGTDNLSGMDETTCTTSTYSGPDVADLTISGSCLDYAGNEGSGSFEFNYDATAPLVTITAARDPDVFGWYNHTIGFTASGQDATSGISQCSTIADYSGPDSADAWVTGACVDYAGNEGSQTLSFQYDGTRPVVTVTGVTEGGIYVVTNVPAAGCSTADATSDVLTEASVSVTGGDADGLGDFTATCSGALDNAGNPGDTAIVHYTVVSTAFYTLKIDKTTNGGDGLEIMVGAPVTWTYVVTNVSDKNLTSILVNDDDLGQVCKINRLAPQTSRTCTKTGVAVAGLYTNRGYATVTVDGTSYTAEDDSSYFGAAPAIDVEKLVSVDLGTTWEDADSPTGPDAIAGEPVQFKFIITNAGNVDLSSITLSDTDLSLPACTTPGTLAAGSFYECVVEIPATLGQHTNTATATGEYNGLVYTDSDNANYHGRNLIEPSIAINSLTITINKARTTVSGLFTITDESQDGTAADGYLIDLTDYGIDWQVKAPKAKVYTPVIPSGGCTYSLAAVDYDQPPDWQSGDPITFDESLTIGYTCTFGSTQLPAGGTLQGTAWGYHVARYGLGLHFRPDGGGIHLRGYESDPEVNLAADNPLMSIVVAVRSTATTIWLTNKNIR